jgi:hypothetical protein
MKISFGIGLRPSIIASAANPSLDSITMSSVNQPAVTLTVMSYALLNDMWKHILYG